VRLRRYIPPISILVFITLTLAGTYFVRLRINEKHMVAAMDMRDKAALEELANSFPSPVNARDELGRTPLHRAAEWNDAALAQLFLRKGADVNAKTDNATWSNGNEAMLYPGGTPLHAVSFGGGKEIAELLIANGADVNARCFNGWTPLHLAADLGRTEILKLLIANGAYINAKDRDGWTPLHAAADSGCRELVEFLIANGADISAKDNKGKTPLQWAVDKKHDVAAEALRKAGAKE